MMPKGLMLSQQKAQLEKEWTWKHIIPGPSSLSCGRWQKAKGSTSAAEQEYQKEGLRSQEKKSGSSTKTSEGGKIQKKSNQYTLPNRNWTRVHKSGFGGEC